MKTSNSNFVRHTYQVSKELKHSEIYQLKEVIGSTQLAKSLKLHCNNKLLTDLIKIEPFLNMPKASNFNKYLRLKNRSSWLKSELITPVIPTSTPNLFQGRCSEVNSIGNSKRTLLLFYFAPKPKRLIIDVFKDYYPASDQELEVIIKRFKTS